MQQFKVAPSALMALLVLAGCKPSAPTARTSTKGSTTKAFLGRWTAKFAAPKANDDDAAGMMAMGVLEALGGPVELEIMEGDRYSLAALGTVTEGVITINGPAVTLTSDHIGGTTLEKFNDLMIKQINTLPSGQGGLRQKLSASYKPIKGSKPVNGVVADDGASISLVALTAASQVMTFTRLNDVQKAAASATVTSPEASLVGKYKAFFDPTHVAQEDRQISEVRARAADLSLNSDNTFSMHFLGPWEGTWKLDGDKVLMSMKYIRGLKPSKPLRFAFERKEGRLVSRAEEKFALQVAFVKE